MYEALIVRLKDFDTICQSFASNNGRQIQFQLIRCDYIMVRCLGGPKNI